MIRAASVLPAWRWLRRLTDRLAVYLPVYLMALVALGTFLLVRNTPVFGPPAAQPEATHDPDYFIRNFTLRSFDAQGRLKGELYGAQARHYPDTDTLEVDSPRVRATHERGDQLLATSRRAISNADGSEIRMYQDAVVTRQPAPGAQGTAAAPLEIRGEFLHVFTRSGQLLSDQPVVLTRGSDRFTADSLDYDNRDRILLMNGRVRGVLMPPARR